MSDTSPTSAPGMRLGGFKPRFMIGESPVAAGRSAELGLGLRVVLLVDGVIGSVADGHSRLRLV